MLAPDSWSSFRKMNSCAMDRRIIPDAFETKNKNLSPESHILALQALNELLRGTVEDRASSGSSRKDPQNAFSRSLGSNLGHEYGLGGPSKKEISSTPDTLVSRKRTRQVCVCRRIRCHWC